jgi:hypothetical protein
MAADIPTADNPYTPGEFGRVKWYTADEERIAGRVGDYDFSGPPQERTAGTTENPTPTTTDWKRATFEAAIEQSDMKHMKRHMKRTATELLPDEILARNNITHLPNGDYLCLLCNTPCQGWTGYLGHIESKTHRKQAYYHERATTAAQERKLDLDRMTTSSTTNDEQHTPTEDSPTHTRQSASLLNITISPEVLSDYNLSGFLNWARTCPAPELVEALDQCTMIEHYMKDPIIDGIQLRPQHVGPPYTERWGIRHYVKTKDCTTTPCERCEAGRGGYQFRHIGPWTEAAWIGQPGETGPQLRQRIHAARE